MTVTVLGDGAAVRHAVRPRNAPMPLGRIIGVVQAYADVVDGLVARLLEADGYASGQAAVRHCRRFAGVGLLRLLAKYGWTPLDIERQAAECCTARWARRNVTEPLAACLDPANFAEDGESYEDAIAAQHAEAGLAAP